ncbi:MAG: tripartite tricarboxylate transporter substrate binding protein [Acetobacteraceae bacterium]|nr:tripartite tricarboxylate transporter substrate binding protein [Acetobacteraceae bacterium]
MIHVLSRRALLASVPPLLAAPALAQGFPQRPIRFISPFPAGGIIDLVIRAVSDDLAAELGQSVVVEVRTGAGGMIAAQNLAQSPPDGHSWLLASLGHVVGPLLQPQPFHPVESFQGLTQVSHAVSVVTVPAASPFRSVAEFVAAARAEPGRLNYLRPGNGSFAHMATEILQRAQSIRLTAVDYRGLPPGVVDLIAGRLDVAVLAEGLAAPHVREGRLRALAAVGTTRAILLPDLPTLGEQGIAGADVDSWYIVIAPRGLPEPVLNRISVAWARVLSRPAVQDRLRGVGTVPSAPMTPAATQALLAREYETYATLVREAGIRADG